MNEQISNIYKEDKYFTEFKEDIINLLKILHGFEKCNVIMHHRFMKKEYDVFITTKRLLIGIEIKEENNYLKVFEQALERLDYVNHMYVLIGWHTFVPLTFSMYLDAMKYCQDLGYKVEDFLRIGILQAIINEKYKKVFLWKRSFTKEKAKGFEPLLKYIK